jgi:hypothetical protein
MKPSLAMFAQFGYPVWFLILSCLAVLAIAARFAWAGGQRTLRVLAAVSVATLFSTLSVSCMGLVMAGRHAAAAFEGAAAGAGASPDKLATFIVGASEAIAGGVMGFGALTWAGILVAIGLFRRVPIT